MEKMDICRRFMPSGFFVWKGCEAMARDSPDRSGLIIEKEVRVWLIKF